MTAVLDGVRVIEVAEWGFVPSAATVLGDWGAEVVKIEHPRHGDPIRGLVTSGLVPGASGRNFFVEHLGRNKRSVGIDLKQPEGRELVKALAPHFDVFAENFKAGAMRKMGLAYDDIAGLMGWSLAKVKVEIFRAREILRDELASYRGVGR